ncbi:MAG: stage V sporulation protein S [Bacteroidota bacterium]
MAVIRISGRTNLFLTTRAIVAKIHRHRHVEIEAMDDPAARDADKAIARATAFLEEEGITIVSEKLKRMPGLDGMERKGIRFIIRVVKDPFFSPGLPRYPSERATAKRLWGSNLPAEIGQNRLQTGDCPRHRPTGAMTSSYFSFSRNRCASS